MAGWRVISGITHANRDSRRRSVGKNKFSAGHVAAEVPMGFLYEQVV